MPDTSADTTRRAVMLGAGGAGLAAVLTGCAGYGQQADSAAQAQEEPEPEPDSSSAAPKKKKKAAEAELTGTADIPEGGGKVFKDQKVVVTQPTAGEFRCFTAVCTHAGCTVDAVADGTINCPCHGSKFKVADGSVADGPAGKALAEKKIKVDGDKIFLA